MAIKNVVIKTIALSQGAVEVNAEVYSDRMTINGMAKDEFIAGFSFSLKDNIEVRTAALNFDEAIRSHVHAAIGFNPTKEKLS